MTLTYNLWPWPSRPWPTTLTLTLATLTYDYDLDLCDLDIDPSDLDPFWPWHWTIFSATILKTKILHFLPSWPWPLTLTFELVRDIVVLNVCTKFQVRSSNRSACWVQTDTHTQTDATENITSSANAGGKNLILLNWSGSAMISVCWLKRAPQIKPFKSMYVYRDENRLLQKIWKVRRTVTRATPCGVRITLRSVCKHKTKKWCGKRRRGFYNAFKIWSTTSPTKCTWLRDQNPPSPLKIIFADLHWSQEWSWGLEKNLKSDNYLKIFIPAV